MRRFERPFEPDRPCQEFWHRHGCLDGASGKITRHLIAGAGAMVILRGCRSLLRGVCVLHCTAGCHFLLLLRVCTAPAHRQCDAKAQYDSCEAGQHAMMTESCERHPAFKRCQSLMCRSCARLLRRSAEALREVIGGRLGHHLGLLEGALLAFLHENALIVSTAHRQLDRLVLPR